MNLINDIKDLKSILGGVQRNMDFDTWSPFVRQAESRFVVPEIGEALYAELLSSSLSDPTKIELKHRLKVSVAQYAYLFAIPKMTVVTSDAGIVQPSPGNAVVITKWMLADLKATTLKNAEDALEDALSYLEEHEYLKNENNEYVFQSWLGSLKHQSARKLFLRSTTVMTNYFPPMNYSRRMYRALVHYLERSEEDFIRPILGDDLFEELKNKFVADTEISKEEMTVIHFLRQSLAYHAFASSLRFLNFGEDFRLISTTDGLLNENVVSDSKLSQMKAECEETYKRYVRKLVEYLNKTASETILKKYFESDLYKFDAPKGANRSRFIRRNDDKSKSFVVF